MIKSVNEFCNDLAHDKHQSLKYYEANYVENMLRNASIKLANIGDLATQCNHFAAYIGNDEFYLLERTLTPHVFTYF